MKTLLFSLVFLSFNSFADISVQAQGAALQNEIRWVYESSIRAEVGTIQSRMDILEAASKYAGYETCQDIPNVGEIETDFKISPWDVGATYKMVFEMGSHVVPAGYPREGKTFDKRVTSYYFGSTLFVAEFNCDRREGYYMYVETLSGRGHEVYWDTTDSEYNYLTYHNFDPNFNGSYFYSMTNFRTAPDRKYEMDIISKHGKDTIGDGVAAFSNFSSYTDYFGMNVSVSGEAIYGQASVKINEIQVTHPDGNWTTTEMCTQYTTLDGDNCSSPIWNDVVLNNSSDSCSLANYGVIYSSTSEGLCADFTPTTEHAYASIDELNVLSFPFLDAANVFNMY